jgi:hypothetical protein
VLHWCSKYVIPKEGPGTARDEGAIMATPYTGLFIAASCNSRSGHSQVHPFHGQVHPFHGIE